MNETESIFARVWRDSELAYSGVLAQTLSLSTEYRSFFLCQLAQIVGEPVGDELREAAKSNSARIRTERDLGTLEENSGRIDIYAEFPGLVLGIENKKTAGLQENQLTRYQTYLRLRQESENYVLIFLAPSKYKLPDAALPANPERFVKVTYKSLTDWTTQYISVPGLPDFERRYFEEFRNFTGELEMKPLSNEELIALGWYKSSLEAYKKIQELASGLGKLESSPDYILVRKEQVTGFPVYLGFRLTKDWYFNAPLLDQGGEVVAYVKDEEADSEIAREFGRVLREAVANPGQANDLGSKCEYFPRREKDECRLAFRRALVDFVGQEPSRITDWLNEKASFLQGILEAAQASVRGAAGPV